MPESAGGQSGGRAAGSVNTPSFLVFIALLVVALLVIDGLVLEVVNPARAMNRHSYMALGNSLSFGYQPDLNFTSGFVDDLFGDLQHANVADVVNYACGGETTTTMIDGECPFRYLPHTAYTGPQLDAAVNFLQAHRGLVSPITLEIGANDVLPDYNQATCTSNGNVDADIALADHNLTQTILPRLVNAITSPTGTRTGDLHLINYYNPFAKECPSSSQFVDKLNAHLAADAGQFRIPVVDVYNAFGGDLHTADHICSYTWICDPQFHDFHPTSAGYALIANTIETALGYPLNPLQNLLPGNISAPSTLKPWDEAPML